MRRFKCAILLAAFLLSSVLCTHAENKVYYINQPVNTKLGVTITLLSVTESNGTNEFTRPEKGNIFVICEFLFENNSKLQVWVDAMDDFGARADGDEFYVDYSVWAMAACDPFFNKSVRPGQKLQGKVGFEVSKDWEFIDIDYFDWTLFNETLEWEQYTFRYEKSNPDGKAQGAASGEGASVDDSTSQSAVAEANDGAGVIYIEAGTNVRSAASSDSKLVTTLDAAGQYTYYELVSGWYRIKLDDGSFGYVFNSRCKVIN